MFSESLNARAVGPLVDVLTPDQLSQFIVALPKVDLHRHLEGSFTPEALVELGKQHGIPLPCYDVEGLRPHVQITPHDKSLIDFLKKFEVIGEAFISLEVIEGLAYSVVEDAAKDNLRYLELRFSPVYMAKCADLDPEAVTRAVINGTARACADHDIRTNFILIIERQLSLDAAWKVEQLTEELCLHHPESNVVALDLANDEFNFPPGPFAPVFQKAASAGIKLDVHASEAGGAENTRVAIEELHADRIGHGTRIRENPAVVALVKDENIPLEMCITSNIQTCTVKSLDDHPFLDYHRSNIPVTINTDDPGVSGITMSSELLLITSHFRLSLVDLWDLTRNGAEHAFLKPEEKALLYKRLEVEFAEAARAYGLLGVPDDIPGTDEPV